MNNASLGRFRIDGSRAGPSTPRRSAQGPRIRSAHRCRAAQNYYEVLGVEPDAPLNQIKARYRELAKTTHPDVNGAADAAEQFLAVRRAYDVLSQEMLRAEHDQNLGLATQRNNDPRFARFNRWRAEVVPELRGQMQIWSDEVGQIIRDESASWLQRRRDFERLLAEAADAAEALRAAGGGGMSSAVAVAAAGASRFGVAEEAELSTVPVWEYGWGGASSGGGQQREDQQQQHRQVLLAGLEERLAELAAQLAELRRGSSDVQACVQRQYDKRLEQVQARYRVYGEIVWYDIFEEAAGAWLTEAARQAERQRSDLEVVEESARQLQVLADATLR